MRAGHVTGQLLAEFRASRIELQQSMIVTTFEEIDEPFSLAGV